jgi:hypothetical protein
VIHLWHCHFGNTLTQLKAVLRLKLFRRQLR